MRTREDRKRRERKIHLPPLPPRTEEWGQHTTPMVSHPHMLFSPTPSVFWFHMPRATSSPKVMVSLGEEYQERERTDAPGSSRCRPAPNQIQQIGVMTAEQTSRVAEDRATPDIFTSLQRISPGTTSTSPCRTLSRGCI